MVGYIVSEHSRMIRDEIRTASYAEALRRCVNPNTVVLDIGTGVGIFAMLACRFGARKVYAIEADDVIQIARELASVNGCSERIEFLQDISKNVTLEERADVLVSDMRGVLPTFQENLASIIDARQRMLKPGGTIIPKSDTLWAVPVEAAESYNFVRLPWDERAFGFEWGPAARVATNDWFKAKGKLTPSDFLATPKPWATIDYLTLESPNVFGQVSWTAERDGTGHGLALWFDSLMVDGIGFSNAPGCPPTIYGQAFFPWPESLRIRAGDSIDVELMGELIGNKYLWRWKTKIRPYSTETDVTFRQSNFFTLPLNTRRST